MGTTPTYAWPYPELTDPPDGAAQMKALALAIDTTIDTRTKDTGWVDPVTINFGTGWGTTGNVIGRRKGDICWIYLQAKRTGATITADARGLCATSLIGTITDTRFYPKATTVGIIYLGFSAAGAGSFLTTGAWNLNALGFNAATLLVNDPLLMTLCYFAATPI